MSLYNITFACLPGNGRLIITPRSAASRTSKIPLSALRFFTFVFVSCYLMNRKPHTEAAKAKISKALKGRPGKSPSMETRIKIGLAGKGRVFSEQARKNMGVGHRMAGTSEERSERAAKVLDARQDPRWMKGPQHLSAVTAVFVSPTGQVYKCHNIAHFVREHTALFNPEDVMWYGRHSRICRASIGLQAIRRALYETDEKRLKKLGHSWKGWTSRIPTECES